MSEIDGESAQYVSEDNCEPRRYGSTDLSKDTHSNPFDPNEFCTCRDVLSKDAVLKHCKEAFNHDVDSCNAGWAEAMAWCKNRANKNVERLTKENTELRDIIAMYEAGSAKYLRDLDGLMGTFEQARAQHVSEMKEAYHLGFRDGLGQF